MKQDKTETAEKAKGGRGGARLGAGRKAKWGQKTVVMRVPEGLRAEVEEFVRLRSEGVSLVREDEVEARVAEAMKAALSAAETQTVPTEKPKSRKKAAAKQKATTAGTEQASLFDLEAFMQS